jgi:large subunit ribosomal protein L2
MGKRLIHQRRGKGSPTFKASSRGIAAVNYIPYSNEQREKKVFGQVVDLLDDVSKTAILAKIRMEDGKETYNMAAEGINIGRQIEFGKEAAIEIGNVLPLKHIPEGAPVFNMEVRPGDGGKLVRGSGVYALIVSKEAKKVQVKLPSNKMIRVHEDSRATIGNVSSGSRTEKPFMKAGKKYHAKKARKKRHRIVRGVAMNPDAHPFGGAQHHPGKSKSTARSDPAGRKVGAIASKRTGRRKRH